VLSWDRPPRPMRAQPKRQTSGDAADAAAAAAASSAASVSSSASAAAAAANGGGSGSGASAASGPESEFDGSEAPGRLLATIGGTNGATKLDAPSGVVMMDELLYVADATAIRVFK